MEDTARPIILLIDDDEVIREVGSRLLQKLGYQVLPAETGAEAIEALSRQADKVALVIFDMVMPDMAADALFDRMKSLAPKARFLLSSGYNRDEDVNRILARGCDRFIQKPFQMEELRRTIKEILGTDG